ncbi:hypothetical protein O6H91_12G106300 [Diphasiastrum complanatum]|uniref:Uncharacterized protein n=1 Tax=Diphasiastrum complanatum TaxID=34168 RepID=A0ACC2C5J7_DIPCM|nr:hypothetical protein O6H91_12G106300 [Diphasiastrum complanatum]
MAMASMHRSMVVSLVWTNALLLLVAFVISDDSTNTQVLADINKYRESAGVPLLQYNPGAACMANQVAQQYKNTQCNNVTEADTSPGLESDFPNYLDLLNACKLALLNTTGGQVLADCIPVADLSSAAAIATQNFTLSQEYQKYINMSDYTSAGVGSYNVWFVLVLATNTSSGNYAETNAAQSPYSISCFMSVLLGLTGVLLSV